MATRNTHPRPAPAPAFAPRREAVRARLVMIALLLIAALACTQSAQARVVIGPPAVLTGTVGHGRGGALLLQGTINPRGFVTTYHFDYGPTLAYGSQTPTAALPAGTSIVKVGQILATLRVGYHYRLVASNARGTTAGKDRVYIPRATRLKVELAKLKEAVPYGHGLVLTGLLTGGASAGHRVALQESKFPYLEGFVTAGTPQVTSASGRFSFRVPTLLTSTEYRVVTLDPRPLLSRTVTAHVSVRVSFHVHSSARRGIVRMYGTVSPALVGARVLFQLQKAVRPGSRGLSEKAEERAEERGETPGMRFATQASTVVKRGTRSFARFSLIVKVKRTGRYRALVIPRRGALVSGFSQTIVVHAAPSRRRSAR